MSATLSPRHLGESLGTAVSGGVDMIGGLAHEINQSIEGVASRALHSAHLAHPSPRRFTVRRVGGFIVLGLIAAAVVGVLRRRHAPADALEDRLASAGSTAWNGRSTTAPSDEEAANGVRSATSNAGSGSIDG